MLIIDTYLRYSKEKGIGLFSNQQIYKGQKIWIRNELFDKIFTPNDIKKLNNLSISYLKKYGVLEVNGNWYLCSDNSRFSNHSYIPNTIHLFNEKRLAISEIAIRNINKDEEILCNYSEICQTCKEKIPFL